MRHYLLTILLTALCSANLLSKSLFNVQSKDEPEKIDIANVDLSLLTGLGKDDGRTQMTFGINAAILKSASEAFSFGIGAGYLCNVDYGVEGNSSKSDSYIPIFARAKFKTPISPKSNFVFDLDGGCAVRDNAHMLISPQAGFDFKLGESNKSIATKLMYHNIIGTNGGVWGITVSLSL